MNKPLVHFLLIGAALLALDRGLDGVLSSAGAGAAGPIVISAQRADELRRDWLATSGHFPDAAELRALIDGVVDDEILYREALARGLDRGDLVVRRRLVRNMRFTAGNSMNDDADLYRQALALGMDRRDLVVRRRLIQKMRFLLQAPADAREPSNAELTAYARKHPARFLQPARARFVQIFLSRERHGRNIEADARRLLARLTQGRITPSEAKHFGDPFLLPRNVPLQSASEIAKQFGPEFGRTVLRLDPGRWLGPVPSSYGLHLVWVYEHQPVRLPPLALFRNRARESLIAERRQAEIGRTLRELRRKYTVRQEAQGRPATAIANRGDSALP